MSLIRFTSQTMGRPYRLGGYADQKGADCFSNVWDYLGKKMDLPKEYEGLTMGTYAELYRQDPEQAKCIMICLMKDLLIEIPPHEALAGDVLRVSAKIGESVDDYLAIDGGNGNLICVAEKHGVSVWPKRFYHIKEAYRWPQQ